MKKKCVGIIAIVLIISLLPVRVDVYAQDGDITEDIPSEEKLILPELDTETEDTELGDKENNPSEPKEAEGDASVEEAIGETELETEDKNVIEDSVTTKSTGIIASGSFGVDWTLYEDGLLEIKGEGGMEWMAMHILAPYKEKITSVVIGDGVSNICSNLFQGCENLLNVEIAESVEYIDDYAFEGCSKLISINIPAKVNFINFSVFEGCSSLESFTVSPESLYFISVDGVLFSKDMTRIVRYPSAKSDSEFILPDGVESIERNAFEGNTYLKKVSIPDSAYSINVTAFAGCTGLTEVRIPEYAFMGGGVFSGCTSLVNLVIPAGVRNIDFTTFSGCTSLTNLVIDPENPEYCVEDNVLFTRDKTKLLAYLSSNKRESYTVPDGVKKIGWQSFDGTKNLKNIIIPASVDEISSFALQNCPELVKITMLGEAPVNDESIFNGNREDLTIYVPKDAIGYDKEPWSRWNIVYQEEIISYKVAFKGNSGSGSMSTVDFTAGEKNILPKNKFTRKYYQFAGWNTKADGTGTKYKDQENIDYLRPENGKTVTLYAQWEPVKYKITYVLNSGTNNKSNPSTYKYTDKTITLKNPSKKGYSFAGWYTSDTYKKKLTTIPKGSTGNKKLYAKWKKVTYKITYDKKGGSISGKYPTTYTVTDTVTLPKPYRKGYTFTGWSTGSTSNIMKISKGSTGNKSYTAKWKLSTYQITYNLRGGINNSKNPKTYTIVTSTITLQNPSRKGYKFAGWYKDPSYKTRIKTISKGTTGGIDAFAKWQAKDYSIVYDKNGGSGSMSKTSCKYDKSYSLKANTFKRTGYHFAGWAKSAKGSVEYSDKKTVSNLTSTDGKEVRLYAVWSPNVYNIKFYNGDKKASGSMNSMKCKYNTSYTLTANSFKKTGYHFVGWAKSAGGKVVYKNKDGIKNLSTSSGAVIKLYAVWEVNSYTVKFNGNSATKGKMTDMKCVFGKKYTLRSNAFSNGVYKFAGWSTSAKGNVKYKNKESVSNVTSSNNKTVTLYAQWSYIVEYKSSESVSGKTANTTLYKGVAGKLAENGFTNKGRVFTGWNTKKDGTGVNYAAGQNVVDLKPNSKGVVTLYAQWEDQFLPRTVPPAFSDSWYLSAERAGFSANAPKGNCTWYAWGRAYEITGVKPVFSGNAKEWWNSRNNYAGYSEDITKPKEGAIIVWGVDGYSGAGHVAVVEEILSDGSLIISESSYGGLWYVKMGQHYKTSTGEFNYYGSYPDKLYWGSARYTIEQLRNVKDGDGNFMGFRGYIYLK